MLYPTEINMHMHPIWASMFMRESRERELLAIASFRGESNRAIARGPPFLGGFWYLLVAKGPISNQAGPAACWMTGRSGKQGLKTTLALEGRGTFPTGHILENCCSSNEIRLCLPAEITALIGLAIGKCINNCFVYSIWWCDLFIPMYTDITAIVILGAFHYGE